MGKKAAARPVSGATAKIADDDALDQPLRARTLGPVSDLERHLP